MAYTYCHTQTQLSHLSKGRHAQTQRQKLFANMNVHEISKNTVETMFVGEVYSIFHYISPVTCLGRPSNQDQLKLLVLQRPSSWEKGWLKPMIKHAVKQSKRKMPLTPVFNENISLNACALI